MRLEFKHDGRHESFGSPLYMGRIFTVREHGRSLIEGIVDTGLPPPKLCKGFCSQRTETAPRRIALNRFIKYPLAHI